MADPIGTTLKKARRERGESQHEAASLLGVSRTTVKNWESGRTSPDYKHRNLLAQYLGVDFDTVTDGCIAAAAARREVALG